MQEKVSGAKVLAHSFSSQGIKMFFTVPTPRLTPLLQTLKQEENVRVVTAHNETAAALMAEGYIRRSQSLAAVITDAGARAISQICGVTNAWADKVPLVSLSLSENNAPDSNKSVERWRFDQKASFQAVTSWNIRLKSLETASREISKCLEESCRHKMGPVHIDIPCGFLNHMVPADLVSGGAVMPSRPVEPVRMRAQTASVAQAAQLLLNAKKPLIFCGGGVKASDACVDLMKLVETLGIPVATSMAGIGSVPVSHPLCLGGPSYTSGEVFHTAIKDADVVLALGAAFSGLDGFGLPPLWSGKIRFIHVDIDPMQLGLNVQPEVSIMADVKTFLQQLTKALAKERGATRPEWKRWSGMLRKLKQIRYVQRSGAGNDQASQPARYHRDEQ